MKPLNEPRTDLLRENNHRLGCILESIGQVLRFRNMDEEARILYEVAARLK